MLGAAGRSAAAAQPVPAEPAARVSAHAAAERTLGVRDVGIFSDLEPRLQLVLPRGLSVERVHAAVDGVHQQLVLYADDWPVKVYPLGGPSVLVVGAHSLALRPGDRAELAPLLSATRLHVFTRAVELPPGDLDGDGIPDPLDISIGAHKTVLNADRYDGRYQHIPYPNGDVPRGIGVCTDVIVRALRNAGCDLQRALHEDLVVAPHAYPGIARPNASIDHRRVKSLLPYFTRHFEAHGTRLDDPRDPLRAGDIVLMDTFPSRPGAEHIGLVADVDAHPGLPMVVNNWTDGTRTARMELLSWVPVTHRFRYPARLRAEGPISIWTTQLVVVSAEGWDERRAKLTRYERAPGQPWHAVGAPVRALLGHAGYAWGDGVHGVGAPAGRAGPSKREGDGRSPAGLFALGTVRGTAPAARVHSTLSYLPITPDQVCVDDPASTHYNQVISARSTTRDYQSAESMQRGDALYELAIEVAHNADPVRRDHGSCIFVHPWAGPDTRLTGCTGMAKADLETLIGWLTPAALWVALPLAEYRALRASWQLP